MTTLEDEIRDLRERNNELVQKVQFWKVAAANKENEKLDLMKEINELRLKLSRLRSGGAAQARKLDAELQTASEEALTHLVKASSAVARTIELAKTYMQDRQDLDNASPRWSAIGGTPNSERVHRVPPLLIGGQSIQPVVSLSRTLFDTSSNTLSRSIVMSRSPNQNRNVTERALPVHMLQDVYIPLTRIDVSDFSGNNMETETEANDLDNSVNDLGLEDSGERSVEDSQNMSDSDEFETSRRLEAVAEDLEPEDEDTPSRNRSDSPLEGPSWLLDRPTNARSRPRSKTNLEPDSTTQLDENSAHTPTLSPRLINEEESGAPSSAFSPTVRRRKRTSSPRRRASLSPAHAHNDYSPRPHASRRNSNSGRVLKVLVAKMRLDSDSDDEVSPPKRPTLADTHTATTSRDISPTKRLMGFDAPSPNGATDARVIVLEQTQKMQSDRGSGEPMSIVASRRDSRISSESRKSKPRDCGDGQEKMGFGDGQTHNSDRQNRLAERIERRSRSHKERMNEDENMIVTYRVGKVGESSAGNRGGNRESADEATGNVSQRRPKVRDVRRDEEQMEVSNRDSGNDRESRLASEGDCRLGSTLGDTSRLGSVGLDGRDSDSSTEQVREGRTRRPRKEVVYKEKPLNRKMRR